jgi:hypothetical protein
MSRILRQLADEGQEFDEVILGRISLYHTKHVNRFGKYMLNLDRENPAPDFALN